MSRKPCQGRFVPAHEIEDGYVVRLVWDMLEPMTPELAERMRPVFISEPKPPKQPKQKKTLPGKVWKAKK